MALTAGPAGYRMAAHIHLTRENRKWKGERKKGRKAIPFLTDALRDPAWARGPRSRGRHSGTPAVNYRAEE